MLLCKYTLFLGSILFLGPVLGRRSVNSKHRYLKPSGFAGLHRSSAVPDLGHPNPPVSNTLPPRVRTGGHHDVKTSTPSGTTTTTIVRNTFPIHVYLNKEPEREHEVSLDGVEFIDLEPHLSHGSHFEPSNYKPQPGDVCKFTIKKENGGFEEKVIDCQVLSSLILQGFETEKIGNRSTVKQTTVVNFKTVNITDVGTEQMSNDTSVSLNAGTVTIPYKARITENFSQSVNASTTLHSNSTSVGLKTAKNITLLRNISDNKETPVDVKPRIRCFGMKTIYNKTKIVPCSRLPFAKLHKRNLAINSMPTFNLVVIMLIYCVTYYFV